MFFTCQITVRARDKVYCEIAPVIRRVVNIEGKNLEGEKIAWKYGRSKHSKNEEAQIFWEYPHMQQGNSVSCYGTIDTKILKVRGTCLLCFPAPTSILGSFRGSTPIAVSIPM